jgi:hypothetical protein
MNALKIGSKRLLLVMLASLLHSEDDAANLFDAFG